ncbi:MAG: winged-helix domain-containing protein [Anaerolineae bacterium]|nr:winged-helix domain-containing protein [Anaerolineae bacterium]
MKSHHILFVVRHRSVEAQLASGLAKYYEVIVVQSRREAVQRYTESKMDLVLIHLPSLRFDLARFCTDLQSRNASVPFFFLLGKGMRLDQLPRADGYLRQPFTLRQLLLRLTRALPEHSGEIVQWHSLRLDTESNTLMWGAKQVPVTPKQATLVLAFLQAPEEILSRARLMQDVWGTDYLGDTRTLDVHLHWLRKSLIRLEAPFIVQTVKGKGYCLIASSSKPTHVK